MEVTASAKAARGHVPITAAWQNGSKDMSRSSIVVLVADRVWPDRNANTQPFGKHSTAAKAGC